LETNFPANQLTGAKNQSFQLITWLLLAKQIQPQPSSSSLILTHVKKNDTILTEWGLERELMRRVAKLKLQYFGHITWGSAGQLALTVLEGIMEGLRHQGRPRREWIHDIEEWTGCEYIQLKEMSQDRAQ